jgi:hypothetical protein
VPLYEGGSAYEDVLAELRAQGFRLTLVEPVLVDPETGWWLQANGTFVRGDYV